MSLGAVLVVTAVVAFWLGSYRGRRNVATAAASVGEAVTWTCAMHPQVQLPKAGQCPICFMDLIPLDKASAGSGRPRELVMSADAAALADIVTSPVERRLVTNTVRMVGKVDYDETKLASITAWSPGRIDRLFIDYTGVAVRRGDHMVSLYSPDLVVAQRELILAFNNHERYGDQRDDDLVRGTLESAEEKLRLLGLLDEQIEEIKERGTPADHVTIYAPVGGVVIHKNATEGTYVQTGTQIYTIADLSQVWVYMDAYETDVPWLRYGQEVEFTTESYPGDIFKGRIAFMAPVLDEKTRTVRVRVNVPNPAGRLKPGMFVRARAMGKIAEGGQVIDQSLAGKWISPHHPEIIKDGPGKCDICGTDLVPAEELGLLTDATGTPAPLVIPASAPLLTGKRAVVYVKTPGAKEPTFVGREVLLGHRADDYYIVRHGLSEGEEVVTNGAFKIDSALQIAAEPSMMNPAGGATGGEHQHHGEAAPAPEAGPPGETRAPIDAPGSFRRQLRPVAASYLEAGEALAQDDLRAAREAVSELLAAAKAIDASALGDKDLAAWESHVDPLIFAAYETLDARDRTAARRRFRELSGAVAGVVGGYGNPLDEALFEFRSEEPADGASVVWLQVGQEARNPFLASEDPDLARLVATFRSQAPLEIPASFQMQLARLYEAYWNFQSALVMDQQDAAVEAVGHIIAELAAIDAGALDERGRQAWGTIAAELTSALDAESNASVDAMRAQFAAVSRPVLRLFDEFGHAHAGPLLKVYCPMALDNAGAAWIQVGEEISNPYMGQRMPRCGEITRRYGSSAAGESLRR